MKTNIIVNLTVEGLHCWKEAEIKLPEVAYLSNLHRHNFYITCKQEVQHHNRQKEFIMLKHEIFDHLLLTYFDEQFNCMNFDTMSCEMIAVELFEKFGLSYCSVLEDGECGGEIVK
jgi:hypothetical protein